MRSVKIMSLVLILTLSSTTFSGCKREELAIATLAVGVTGAIFEGLNFVFPKGLEEFNEPKSAPSSVQKSAPSSVQKSAPSPIKTNPVVYRTFVDQTYGFSFDYPVEINGKNFDGKPKIIAMLEKNSAPTHSLDGIIQTTSIVTNNSGVISGNVNVVTNDDVVISGNGGHQELNKSGKKIKISGNRNTIRISGTGNLVEISGRGNEIYSNNNQFSLRSNSKRNHIYGSGNSILKDSGSRNEFSNTVEPEKNTSVKTAPPKDTSIIEQKISYCINLQSSKIYVVTQFCNGYEDVKSELEKRYPRLESTNLGNRTFDFRYGNSQMRAFFGENASTNKRQRFYYVEWVCNSTSVSELDKKIAAHVFDSFKATRF